MTFVCIHAEIMEYRQLNCQYPIMCVIDGISSLLLLGHIYYLEPAKKAKAASCVSLLMAVSIINEDS